MKGKGRCLAGVGKHETEQYAAVVVAGTPSVVGAGSTVAQVLGLMRTAMTEEVAGMIAVV